MIWKEIEEHQKKYSEEAKERYGKETVEKVEKRTAEYSAEDWGNIQSKTDEIYKRMIAGMRPWIRRSRSTAGSR